MAISYGNAATGALSRAGIGAAVAGPWGAAAGGILGALIGLFSGNDPEQELAKFDPETQKTIMGLFQSAAQGNPQGFQPIEDRARQQFQTNTIPSLAERFTAMGGGAQRSSAFQGALGNAGSDLESQIAALRGQYGQQQINSLLPALQKDYKTNQPGFNDSLAVGAAQSFPALMQLMQLKQNMGNTAQPAGGFNPVANQFKSAPINAPKFDIGGMNKYALGGGAV